MNELNKIGNKRPFAVPDNYFDGFAEQMESLTQMEEKRKVIRLRPWMYAAAASVVGLFIVVQFFFVQKKEAAFTQDAYDSYVMSQVNESAIYEYYMQNETEEVEDENK